MQVHGKHADDVADPVRYHEIDRALARIERDQAGGDDPPGFDETEMRAERGGRGFRRLLAIE